MGNKTKGFMIISLEIPETAGIVSKDIRKFLVLITEYMSSEPAKQAEILSSHPEFEGLFNRMEQYIVPVLRKRMERAGDL